MSALGKALSAMINGEKPRVRVFYTPPLCCYVPYSLLKSSISDWIDILSSPRYNEDDYEGYVCVAIGNHRP